jgi:uncharacterized protein
MNRDQIFRLLNQGIFPEGDSGKKLIETHISWVIIGKKYVYKIKKPLRLPFLNFSTLSKRKFYCHEELRLNRRLTSNVYLDVLPVSGKNKQYYVNHRENKAIEYVVRMRKLDISRQMDILLKNNKVTKLHIRSIAATISLFHKNAQRIYSTFSIKNAKTDFNDILAVKNFLERNFNAEMSGKIAYAISKSNAFLKKNEVLFKRRIEQGFVRDCHGDMHSRNIFLYSKPVIFDCIEFNKKYRHIDVLHEIAFLCMDLEAFNKYKLSSYLLKIYSGGDLDDELYPLFIYYKALLANVRAKVNAFKAMQDDNENDSFKQNLKESLKYIDLMHSYTLLL